MPVDRPTFSESWYRVAELCPRLRSVVQVHRQHHRGELWYVVQDPGSNQFFRLPAPAYHFVALLNGRRTVAEAWRIAGEDLGDNAPTQGEAIQLLGQLYGANLLHGDLPPDAEGLFKRYRKRRQREVQSYLMNFLFLRFPLIDPDRFLERWVGVFGLVFSWPGLVLWLILLAVGGYTVVENAGLFWNEFNADMVLAPANLPWLYLAMVIIKGIHELGHAFAVKRFGRLEGVGGEVHTIGIMLLVFTPLPYVDASSASAFRNKWHRVVVGAAGILVELAVASVAAVIWAATNPESAVHQVTFNMMFIASVSTLLFNGNPLLRFDGYFILSDLIEIPNLAQRSKDYLSYLVRRYAWRVRNVRNPAHTPGEKRWFVFYGIASTIYRVFISVRILTFIASRYFILGAIMAIAAVVTWLLVPLGKFVHYLLTSPELARTRTRAIVSTVAVVGGLVVGVGFVPVPERFGIEGQVTFARLEDIQASEPGWLTWSHPYPASQPVGPGSGAVLRLRSDQLDDALATALAQREEKRIAYKQAVADLAVEAATGRAPRNRRNNRPPSLRKAELRTELAELDEQIADLRRRRARLEITPEVRGQWLAPGLDQRAETYLEPGEVVARVADPNELIVEGVIKQGLADVIRQVQRAERVRRVEIRVRNRPDLEVRGRIDRILPAGTTQLPSAALGYAAGGSVQTAADDREGTRAAEPFFKAYIAIDPNSPLLLRRRQLRSGQRVVVRITLPDKPLAVQWWRSLLRLLPGNLRNQLL